jgi:hypothetical protein
METSCGFESRPGHQGEIKMTLPVTTIPVTINIDVDNLASDIARSISREECFTLIKAIDDNIAEYDFTERLAKHFQGVIDQENQIVDQKP